MVRVCTELKVFRFSGVCRDKPVKHSMGQNSFGIQTWCWWCSLHIHATSKDVPFPPRVRLQCPFLVRRSPAKMRSNWTLKMFSCTNTRLHRSLPATTVPVSVFRRRPGRVGSPWTPSVPRSQIGGPLGRGAKLASERARARSRRSQELWRGNSSVNQQSTDRKCGRKCGFQYPLPVWHLPCGVVWLLLGLATSKR